MNYENEADYNYAMSAQGEAEAQYYHEQQRQYDEYLEGLIKDKQYRLFGIEICLDLLNTDMFNKSGLSAKEFLCAEKDRINNNKILPTSKDNSSFLDF